MHRRALHRERTEEKQDEHEGHRAPSAAVSTAGDEPFARLSDLCMDRLAVASDRNHAG
jgi:hypothetical protein